MPGRPATMAAACPPDGAQHSCPWPCPGAWTHLSPERRWPCPLGRDPPGAREGTRQWRGSREEGTEHPCATLYLRWGANHLQVWTLHLAAHCQGLGHLPKVTQVSGGNCGVQAQVSFSSRRPELPSPWRSAGLGRATLCEAAMRPDAQLEGHWEGHWEGQREGGTAAHVVSHLQPFQTL